MLEEVSTKYRPSFSDAGVQVMQDVISDKLCPQCILVKWMAVWTYISLRLSTQQKEIVKGKEKTDILVYTTQVRNCPSTELLWIPGSISDCFWDLREKITTWQDWGPPGILHIGWGDYGRPDSPYFIDRETETQIGWSNSSGPLSQLLAELGLISRLYTALCCLPQLPTMAEPPTSLFLFIGHYILNPIGEKNNLTYTTIKFVLILYISMHIFILL